VTTAAGADYLFTTGRAAYMIDGDRRQSMEIGNASLWTA
jgi:hypothetical protein